MLSKQKHMSKNCTAVVLNTVAYSFVPAAHVVQAVRNCFQIKKVESYLAMTFTACCKKSAQHRKSGSCWAQSCIGEVGSALCVGWTDKLWSSFLPTSFYDSTTVLSLGDNSLQCAMTSTSSITHPFSLGKEWETETSADKPQNPLEKTGSQNLDKPEAGSWFVGLSTWLVTPRQKKYLGGNIYFSAHSRLSDFRQFDFSTLVVTSHGPNMTVSLCTLNLHWELRLAPGSLQGINSPSVFFSCHPNGIWHPRQTFQLSVAHTSTIGLNLHIYFCVDSLH